MDKKITKRKKTMSSNSSSEDILSALKQRALGYQSNEVIEEYTLDEHENERLVKKKVTRKNVPPDISAAKVLLEFENQSLNDDLTKLTNEELDEKINEIISKLKESENDN